MKLFAKCEKCGEKGFIVMKRTYNIPGVGIATSHKELCGKCYTKIKNINKIIIKK